MSQAVGKVAQAVRWFDPVIDLFEDIAQLKEIDLSSLGFENIGCMTILPTEGGNANHTMAHRVVTSA